MKYIKKFDDTSNDPQIGDYVICSEDVDDINLENFVKRNVGQFVKRQYPRSPYIIKYDNVPKNLKKRFNDEGGRGFERDEILTFSPNREELELLLKFNI